MNTYYTSYVCDICGRNVGHGDHSECSRQRQEREAGKNARWAAKRAAKKPTDLRKLERHVAAIDRATR